MDGSSQAAMAFIRTLIFLFSLQVGSAVAGSAFSGTSQPTILLDTATVIGQPNGTTIKYLGLPFAQPP